VELHASVQVHGSLGPHVCSFAAGQAAKQHGGNLGLPSTFHDGRQCLVSLDSQEVVTPSYRYL
jgi:hypothetical protein